MDKHEVVRRIEAILHAYGQAPPLARKILHKTLVGFLNQRKYLTSGRETFLDLLSKVIPDFGGFLLREPISPEVKALPGHRGMEIANAYTTVRAGHVELSEGNLDITDLSFSPVLRLYETPTELLDYRVELSPGGFMLLTPTSAGSKAADMLSFQWTPSTRVGPGRPTTNIGHDTRAEPYDVGWPPELNRAFFQGVVAKLHHIHQGLGDHEVSSHKHLLNGVEQFLEARLPLDILAETALGQFITATHALMALDHPKFSRSTEENRLGYATAAFGRAGQLFSGRAGKGSGINPLTGESLGPNNYWVVGMDKPHGESWEFVFNADRSVEEDDATLTLKYSPPSLTGKVNLTKTHTVQTDWND